MLRRLLEASATASAAMPVSSSPVVPSSPALLPLPTAPPGNLTGAALASSGATAVTSGATATAATAAAVVVANSSRAAAVAHPSAAASDAAAAPGLLALNSSSNSLFQPENNEELEYSILAAFSDMETVFLACISTLLPLIVALGIAFGIRHVWRKYKDRRSSSGSSGGLPGYRGVCSRDDTAESLHHTGSQTIIQPSGQILSAQDLVNGIDGPRYFCETEVMEDVVGLEVPASYTSPGSHTSKNANGNIITLTLKNNHLIVETEERAVTMETPTTRTKYQDNGCSVIVEIPPGYQSNNVNGGAGGGGGSCGNGNDDDDDMAGRVTDQQALVHREEIPEDRASGFENTKLFGSTNTGLSQSDLSIASQSAVNPSYCYGNQLEYEADYCRHLYGASSSSTSTFKPLLETSTTRKPESKWVEFDKSPTDNADLQLNKDNVIVELLNSKESSQDSSLEQQDSTDSADTTTVLSNPNYMQNGNSQKILDIDQILTTKPVITGAILKDEVSMSLQEDTFQEQQRKLGNGTHITPEHRRLNEHDNNIRSDGKIGGEQQMSRLADSGGGGGFVPSHKRTGSIPPRLIEESLEIERKKPTPAPLDIYSQIKTSTKSILPGGLSPKFELLQNEVSPVDDKES